MEDTVMNSKLCNRNKKKKSFILSFLLYTLLVCSVSLISAIPSAYGQEARYIDDFSTNTIGEYTVLNTWTEGGVGSFLYDSAGQRARVRTGDNVGLQFSRSVPFLGTGSFSVDFLPTVKYPSGGRFYLRLEQDAANYYLIYNTDGYGPGVAQKVVAGQVVEQVNFVGAYQQGTNYRIQVAFAPDLLRVDAFGGVVVLNQNSVPLTVNRLEVEISQQDAYIDNISYSSEVPNLPPTADAGVDRTVNAAELVVLDGSGSGDPDGTIVSYLWEQTAGPAVTLSGSGAQRSFTAPDVVDTPVALTFRLTVTDDQGATGADTVVVTVLPQGTSSFSDDFSVDSRSQYTVVNTWTDGGVGKFLYDATGQRLQVKTGDNVGLAFSWGLSVPSATGLFSLDFLPTVKYPSGGRFYLRLEQDAANYYLIYNTDGYGPGVVQKVVAGQVVEQVNFVGAYQQGTNYRIQVAFAPDLLRVDAFGGVVVLNQNSVPLTVNRLEVEISQQDAYIDNISYSSEVPNLPPTADAGVDRTVNAAELVVLDGSGSGDLDGTIVSYLWEQTAGPAVTLSGSGAQRSFTAPDVVGTPVALTFRLTVTDDQGATGADTVVVTVLPQGTSSFSDDFSVDSRSQYTVVNTWTDGGVGKFLYDAAGKRLQVKTGDNVGLAFSWGLSVPSATGLFSLDFLPTVKYPSGGRFYLRLEQDAANYYLIYNTDGYGPGVVQKVVAGQVVEQVSFVGAYQQGTNYRIQVAFAPDLVRVDAFGGVVVLNQNSMPVTVNRLEVEISQQDAYIDNISYSSEVPNLPPTADAGVDRTVNEAAAVVLDGSGSGDPDGTIVSYLWEQTAGPAVTLSGSGAQRSFTAPDVVGTPVALTFRLTVTDDRGATGADTVVVTVLPQGTYSFSDDFSVDSRSQYTVVNTWTDGGVGKFLYDATGQRLQVKTGDNVGLAFSWGLSVPSATGLFSLDFLPTVKYPSGGRFYLRLEQDTANYYLIYNTDGYGPGVVQKVVAGQVVEQVSFVGGVSAGHELQDPGGLCAGFGEGGCVWRGSGIKPEQRAGYGEPFRGGDKSAGCVYRQHFL